MMCPVPRVVDSATPRLKGRRNFSRSICSWRRAVCSCARRP